MAIQPDGKIVAGAGAATGQGNVVQVARLEPNGSLDASFGSDGITTAVLSPTALPGSLALQPNGDILVAAGIGNPSIMTRFTSTGQLDTTFGNAGVATLANAGATQIAVQANGKILVAAGETSRLVFEPQPAALPGAISRYNTNGSLDTTFGSSGSAASVASPSALVLQSDGKIVVAGGVISRIHVAPAANDVGFGIVRFNSNGTLDASFGHGGVAIADFGANAPTSAAYAVAIQSNGDIVAAGAAGGKFVVNTVTSSFGLARFTSAGILDTTFGAGGTVITTVGSSGQYSWLTGLAIQGDGKIVVAASAVNYYDYAYVARYLAH